MKYRKIYKPGYVATTKKLINHYRYVYQNGGEEAIRIGYGIDVRSSVNIVFRTSFDDVYKRNMKRDVVDDYKDWGRTFMEAMWDRWNDEV